MRDYEKDCGRDGELLRMEKADVWLGQKLVLPSVDLTVRSGRVTGMVGDNGIGKTVLLKLMAGLLRAAEGKVKRNTDSICYMLSGEHFYPWMRVADAVRFYQDFYSDFDHFRARKLLAESGIEERKQLVRLSQGQRERVCLILALSRTCRIYLMDEPFKGIDPYFKSDIRRFLLENLPENAAVVLATHLLREMEPLMDEVIFVTEDGVRQMETEWIRENYGRSVENYYLEVIRRGKKMD